ncbi:MAG: alcohol dehydrogenase catalytic domain-containing protein [Thermoplasmata archaeon]|nr:alcohol dehydrogenase catalytic domain-containing protein [Thermoplasmata archaeon]
MKFARLAGPGRLGIADAPDPVAGPGEVVVRLAACGVCGTDLEKLKGNYQSAGRIGHEPVGTLQAVGAGVPSLSVGERVWVHHHVPCYACRVCERGEYTFCASYSKSNIDPGGFAEMFRVPSEHVARGAVQRLDDSLSWEVGSLLEPAGCGLTAIRRVGFHHGDSVFVIGLGPVGILYARLARALGAGWVGGSDLSARRRSAAEGSGVDHAVDAHDPEEAERRVSSATGSEGADLVVVATGAPAAVTLGARLVRRGGTLNLFGLPEAGSRLDVDLQQLYLRGVRVVPSYATTERDIGDVQRLLVARRLDLSDLVTHRYPVTEVVKAFEMAARPSDALKVVVTGPAY